MPLNSEKDERGLLAALSLEDKVRLLTGADNWHTHGSELIGLRPFAMSDGPAGVRGVAMDERNPSASLPCPSALGATWDPDLVLAVARALGQEARSKGIGVLLGPTINMMRTPLGGRGFECFAEDPVLAARMAVAYVRGVQQAGVAATLKHFAANDSETGRWNCDVRVAERVLREVYLLPFEACVREADAALVMAGYNKVNGVTMTEHAALLNGMLKREWGFSGVAVSDWSAGRSTVATAAAGLDLLMPGPDGAWGDKLVAAVTAGEISPDDVDDKVIRVLRLARRVGALGSPDGNGAGPDANGAGNGNGGPVLADAGLLRRAAAAAFTLLRNEGQVLPLDPRSIGSIALIGPNALFPVTQGGGSARVTPASVTTPADALRTALAGTGASLTIHQGCVTWQNVPEPAADTLRDPVSGEPGTRLEFRAEDGTTLASEHRGATMFTWWDGLPRGVGDGARGTIVLRARYRAPESGRYMLGAGGVGDVVLTADGETIAAGTTPLPEDPVEAMVRPGEIRTAIDLVEGQDVTLEVTLLPANWATPPISIRLGVAPAADEDAMFDAAVAAASAADVAVLVVGSGAATESEGFDRTSLSLPGRQDELVSRVAAVCDRTVVVVNAGMPVLMPWADQVAAIGCSWLPGQAMGDALADVLLGRVEPGGRLPVTLPRTEADCPVLHAIPAPDGTLAYEEGLLIGYRGYDRAGIEPLFPFGHGLGYTSWEYQAATADCAELPADGDLAVTVLVCNTGNRDGREVVQAYLEPPDDDPENPARALAAFASVTASPGELARVRLCVPRRAFARYDEAAGDWVWVPGEYRLCVGGSSRDLPLEVVVRAH
ncbi:MAG TPA: glycoside hydrolase family 3 C-terminal domain-containing protein [Streptosporangiaceae bacterium]|nr:glycoside hydrolase family 3 C-terminal domain-containing protein [Streptosporangiaceae bacterium]